jgi:hypothetical protein
MCKHALTEGERERGNIPQAGLPYIYHKKRGHLSTIKRGQILFPSQVHNRDTEISDTTCRISICQFWTQACFPVHPIFLSITGTI